MRYEGQSACMMGEGQSDMHEGRWSVRHASGPRVQAYLQDEGQSGMPEGRGSLRHT